MICEMLKILQLQTQILLSLQPDGLNLLLYGISRVYDIGLQIYSDKKIRGCAFVNWPSYQCSRGLFNLGGEEPKCQNKIQPLEMLGRGQSY